jgi:hypothetical protein
MSVHLGPTSRDAGERLDLAGQVFIGPPIRQASTRLSADVTMIVRASGRTRR